MDRKAFVLLRAVFAAKNCYILDFLDSSNDVSFTENVESEGNQLLNECSLSGLRLTNFSEVIEKVGVIFWLYFVNEYVDSELGWLFSWPSCRFL